MNVVANALYYNPALALQQLQAQGRTQAFFATWFQVCLQPPAPVCRGAIPRLRTDSQPGNHFAPVSAFGYAMDPDSAACHIHALPEYTSAVVAAALVPGMHSWQLSPRSSGLPAPSTVHWSQGKMVKQTPSLGHGMRDAQREPSCLHCPAVDTNLKLSCPWRCSQQAGLPCSSAAQRAGSAHSKAGGHIILGPAARVSALHAQMIFATGRSGGPRHFRRVCDKKVNALGMTALLGVPDQALPPELAAGLPQLMAGLIKLLIALKTQQARPPPCAPHPQRSPSMGGQQCCSRGRAIAMFWPFC